MPKNEENQIYCRSIEFNREWLDEKARTADVSMSSETEEVSRWYGVEVLDHNPKAIDFGRIRSIGAHLFNHDPNRIIGPVNKVKVENGRLVGNVGYDDTEEGNLALTRVKSGSLRGISVRYRVIQLKELAYGEEYQLASRTIKGRKDVPVYIVTKWEPIEVTSTALPADSSVGLGRDLTRSLDGIQVVRSGKSNDFNDKDLENMHEDQIRNIIRQEIKSALNGGDSTTNSSGNDGGFSEAERSLINRASAVSPACMVKIAEMIIEGRDLAICSRELHLFVKADATDQGGTGGEGTGKTTTTNTNEQRITSFAQVQDDNAFFQAFGSDFAPEWYR